MAYSAGAVSVAIEFMPSCCTRVGGLSGFRDASQAQLHLVVIHVLVDPLDQR